MFRRVGLFAVLGALACSSKSQVKPTGTDPVVTESATASEAPKKPTFTLFALAEVRGQVGPCGCTTDPLGDLSRTTQLIEQARTAGPVMFVDAGSLLYTQAPIPPAMAAITNTISSSSTSPMLNLPGCL